MRFACCACAKGFCSSSHLFKLFRAYCTNMPSIHTNTYWRKKKNILFFIFPKLYKGKCAYPWRQEYADPPDHRPVRLTANLLRGKAIWISLYKKTIESKIPRSLPCIGGWCILSQSAGQLIHNCWLETLPESQSEVPTKYISNYVILKLFVVYSIVENSLPRPMQNNRPASS